MQPSTSISVVQSRALLIKHSYTDSNYAINNVNKQGKVHPITDHNSPQVSIRIALLFLSTRRSMGISGQHQGPAALPPEEKPGTHFTGGWAGPRAVLDTYTIPIKLVPFTAETKDVRIIGTTSYFLHDMLMHTVCLSPLLPKLRQNVSQISYDLNSLHKVTNDSSDTVVW